MVGNWAALKKNLRQTVHNVMAVSAFYVDETLSAEVPLTVRFHTKGQVVGDLDQQGYATMIENVNRLIFNEPELTSFSLVLRREGTVRFPDYNLAFQLDVRDDTATGPIEVIWTVVKA
jgi:hypothetical protein